MTQALSRKDFLRLSAATAAVAGYGLSAKAQPLPKRAARTLIKGADILTMEKGAADLVGHDLLIENGRIAAIGKALNVADAEVVDIPGAIVMPGLVDGHRHIWEGIDTGTIIKTNQSYLTYYDWKPRMSAIMTPEDFYLAQYSGSLESIDSGVTSVIDYAHGMYTQAQAEAAARAANDSGLSGVFGYQVSGEITFGKNSQVTKEQLRAAGYSPPTDRHFKIAEVLRDKHFSGSEQLMQFGLAMSTNTGRPLQVVAAEARRVRAMQPKLILHHNHKTEPLPAHGVFRHTAEDIRDVGLLIPEYHISHGTRLTDAELRMLAGGGVKLAATPFVEFTYPAHESPIHARAKAAGMDVGIGIDAPLEFTKDFFEQTRGAWWTLFRLAEDQKIAATLKSEDLLAFATRDGARAAGMGDTVGTLKVGKRADLLLLRTDRFGFPVTGGLADRVVNFAALSDIDSVWIAGRRRKRDGRMIDVDWRKLKGQVVETQARLKRDFATIKFL